MERVERCVGAVNPVVELYLCDAAGVCIGPEPLGYCWCWRAVRAGIQKDTVSYILHTDKDPEYFGDAR